MRGRRGITAGLFKAVSALESLTSVVGRPTSRKVRRLRVHQIRRIPHVRLVPRDRRGGRLAQGWKTAYHQQRLDKVNHFLPCSARCHDVAKHDFQIVVLGRHASHRRQLFAPAKHTASNTKLFMQKIVDSYDALPVVPQSPFESTAQAPLSRPRNSVIRHLSATEHIHVNV